MKKTNKTKAKPTDTKPNPPIRKPAKKAPKPSKARYNQPGRGIDETKENARDALLTLRQVATGMLVMKLHAQLTDNDTVALPKDLVDVALGILAAIEVNIIQHAGLEDDYADIDDVLDEDEE
jgi:hypothetical protein